MERRLLAISFVLSVLGCGTPTSEPSVSGLVWVVRSGQTRAHVHASFSHRGDGSGCTRVFEGACELTQCAALRSDDTVLAPAGALFVEAEGTLLATVSPDPEGRYESVLLEGLEEPQHLVLRAAGDEVPAFEVALTLPPEPARFEVASTLVPAEPYEAHFDARDALAESERVYQIRQAFGEGGLTQIDCRVPADSSSLTVPASLTALLSSGPAAIAHRVETQSEITIGDARITFMGEASREIEISIP